MHHTLNNLNALNGPELIQAFAAIPASTTTLDLGGNYFDQKSGAELAQAFAIIPAGVTTLDLSNNLLGQKSGDELAQAFVVIPAGVTTLDLSNNFLGLKSGDELAKAFAAIPAGVTTLHLERNGLFKHKKNTDADQLLVSLNSSVPRFGLSFFKGNGSSTLSRILCPLLALSWAKPDPQSAIKKVPIEILNLILGFAAPTRGRALNDFRNRYLETRKKAPNPPQPKSLEHEITLPNPAPSY